MTPDDKMKIEKYACDSCRLSKVIFNAQLFETTTFDKDTGHLLPGSSGMQTLHKDRCQMRLLAVWSDSSKKKTQE
jgi:hypothetical protein